VQGIKTHPFRPKNKINKKKLCTFVKKENIQKYNPPPLPNKSDADTEGNGD
jgi:hypothetical protein